MRDTYVSLKLADHIEGAQPAPVSKAGCQAGHSCPARPDGRPPVPSIGAVEDAFTDLVQDQIRAAALKRQVAELTTARGQVQEAHAGGAISLTEVRDTDREQLTASDLLGQARAGADRAAVAGFRALGGGWTAG